MIEQLGPRSAESQFFTALLEASIHELKSKGESALTYQTRGFSIGSMLGGGPAPSSGPPQPVDPNILPRATCTLKRVENADVAIPVLVNDQARRVAGRPRQLLARRIHNGPVLLP